jgi:hypothetical protein
MTKRNHESSIEDFFFFKNLNYRAPSLTVIIFHIVGIKSYLRVNGVELPDKF